MILLAVAFGLPAPSWGQMVDEYRLKAAYLFNLVKFVDWPPDTFKSPKDPIVSCLLAEGPVGNELEKAARGAEIGGRALVVKYISDLKFATVCQVLFISSAEHRRWRYLPAAIKTGSVLTVGEADDFAADGGIVNFKLENEKIRIQINVDAAAEGRVKISSRLLSLSQIVRN